MIGHAWTVIPSHVLRRAVSLVLLLAAVTYVGGCGAENAAAPPSSSALPKGSVEEVDATYHGLDLGHIAFNAPSRMDYQDAQVIELLLSPTLPAAKLKGQLEDKTGASAGRTRVANRMEAQLSGRGFAIEAMSPDVQAVGSDRTTRWAWQVTPTTSGQQQLRLTLSAHIDVSGSDTPLVLRTFDRHIRVRVSMSQRVGSFVAGNWQWLWAALAVPLATVVWRRLAARRRASPPPSPQ